MWCSWLSMAWELYVGSATGSWKISVWSTTVRRGLRRLSHFGVCRSVTR